jgi:hypothetical protein
MSAVLVLDARICSVPNEFCRPLLGINGRENVDNDSARLNGPMSRQFRQNLLAYL